MIRKEIIGDATLYLGDCLEIMPTLGKVDAVVTDPPWNMNYFEDDNKPWEEYVVWLGRVINLCRETSEEDAPIWIFQGTNAVPHVAHLFQGWGMFASIKNFSQMTSTRLPNSFDVAFYSSNKGYAGCARNWFLSDTAGMLKERTGHPTPRTLGVMQYIIGMYSANIILDPFMGSATTGVACMNLGRKFIGIEINEDYFNLAVKRIQQAYNQGDLFIKKAAPEVVQGKLFNPVQANGEQIGIIP